VYRRGGSGGGGADRFSPIIDITEIEGGHRVTITDAEGEKSFDVLDGVDGKDGANGKDGVDGAKGEKGDKGDKGDKGEDGADGKDGNDYILTDADKTEITNAVLDEIPEIPTKTSQLANDSNFVTAEYVTNAINGSLDEVEAMIDESGVLE
jgi:hypothetical protein